MFSFVIFRLEFYSRETILKFGEKLWVLSLLLPLPYLVSNGELQVAALHTYLGSRNQVAWSGLPILKIQQASSISVLLPFLQFSFGRLALLGVSFNLYRFVSRLRSCEIRLHALLLRFRCCHCFLQPLHHAHQLLHGHLLTPRTFPCAPMCSHVHVIWLAFPFHLHVH